MKINNQLKSIFFLILLFLEKNMSSQTTYIRTVVHVMYENISQDLSDAAVLNYINEVNKGYSKQASAKFIRTPDIFGSDWANTNIQLCLATSNPNGGTTNGITHTLINDKFITSQSPGAPDNPVWDPTNYLNIYLVPVYSEPGFPSFVIGGWASTPTEPQMGAAFDYVVVSTNSIPFIPELIAHEVGHYFGLKHVGDDILADTPKGMENILPSSGYSPSCNSGLQSINTTDLSQDGSHWGGVDPPDMVENFMGLSFSCQFMFTTMQKNAMQSYISTHHASKIITNCGSITGINELNFANQVQFFPNPNNGIVYIHFDNLNSKIKIKIVDVLGNIVIDFSDVYNDSSIDITKLQNGIYFIKVLGIETGTEFSSKLILAK